jgi:sulfotransferase
MTVDDFINFRPAEESQVVSPTRRVVKTHSQVQHAPWIGGATAEGIPADAKVIVVTRNPKDAAVSMFHHSRDVTSFGYCGDWSHFFLELFVPGKVESGCFWEWHAGWWRAHQSLPDRIMWISYEEMKQDPKGSIQRIAAFCDIDASPSVINAVVEASSFSSMKQASSEEDAKKLAAGQFIKKNHIRQGKAGAWTKVFTLDDSDTMDAHHEAKCSEHGLPTALFEM